MGLAVSAYVTFKPSTEAAWDSVQDGSVVHLWNAQAFVSRGDGIAVGHYEVGAMSAHGFNAGHYEPENCRWATDVEQANNRRLRTTSRMLLAFGRTQNLASWARETGIDRQTIAQRLRRGWSVERALTEACKEAA